MAIAAPEARGAFRLPELVIEAPPELAAIATTLRGLDRTALRPGMELTGLEDAGPPINVVLAPEASPAARSAPAWVSGFTDGVSGIVVLLPERVPRYPDRSLGTLLQHEVAHVLVARAARGRPVPRWFNEGLAIAASRDPDLGDRARVALAVLSDERLPLERIDQAFGGGPRDVELAYALAGDFVQDLLRRYGRGTGASILAGLGRGESFEAAFVRATGARLGAVESSYWRRRTLWDRWVPIATSSAALWAGVMLLALVAFRRRRQRDAAIRRRWEEEGTALDSPDDASDGADHDAPDEADDEPVN